MMLYGLAATPPAMLIIGIPPLIFSAVCDFLMIIISAVRCKNGQAVRHPLSIRFFS